MFGLKSKRPYRQGDVFIEPVDEIPEEIEAVPLDVGRVVLAYGEVTGHAHAFDPEDSRHIQHTRPKRRSEGNVTYLDIHRPVALKHEEHDPVPLPPGKYRVSPQHQWSEEQERQRVLD